MVPTEQIGFSRVTPRSQTFFQADAEAKRSSGDERFPRVLFITPHAFNKTTGTGITFTNLFGGWPKDRIAVVHDDPLPVSSEVCDRYYRLGGREIRKFGRPVAVQPAIDGGKPPGKSVSHFAPLMFAKSVVFGDGLPQSGHLTPELAEWIEAFRPDLIFTILGSIGLMELIGLIQERYSLPSVVHFMDDWPSIQFRRGLLAPLQRRRMEKLVAHLINHATVRLGICEAMCEAFEARYGVAFEAFQNPVDIDRWSGLKKDAGSVNDPVRVIYAGSVFPNAQLESLADCAEAVARLANDGQHIRLDIHSPGFLADSYRSQLEIHTSVRLQDPLTDDTTFFSTLSAADILLMPSNFDAESVRFIRYSMPTRVPAYLASGTPILVYGAPDVAQVNYARQAGWGLTIEDRDDDALAEGMLRLIKDQALRQSISRNAISAARTNHDISGVRTRFHNLLRETANVVV